MSEIITECSKGILSIQLNRPEKKNAITMSMYNALAEVITAAETDATVRVILLHGAGDAFCAGNDLGDFAKNPPRAKDSPQERLIHAVINCNKPMVAAVHGFVVGIGTTILTQCDFVYAGESAKFQMPFINLALVPEFGTSLTVPASMGYLAAAELIFLGEFFDAKRALELGLVTRIVSDIAVLETAKATAQKLALKPSSALQACKKLMKDPMREQLREVIKIEFQEYGTRLQSEDTKEAITAFFEKRAPNFK